MIGPRATRMRRGGALACLALGLAAVAPVRTAELKPESLRAYTEYVTDLRRSYEERMSDGRPLTNADGVDLARVVRDGRVVVEGARRNGIFDVRGGLIHHWKGAVFIPQVTLRDVVAVGQDYASYKRVYAPIVNSSLVDRNGDTFHVRMRLQRRSGLVSAVLDVSSVVHYQWHGDALVYSASESERIAEVRDAGQPNERQLPPDQGSGYLWRAATFSRFAQQDAGVLVELENIGLSRSFPPLLGWLIEPIARRIGRGSVEDSLQEFRAAVVAASAAPGAAK